MRPTFTISTDVLDLYVHVENRNEEKPRSPAKFSEASLNEVLVVAGDRLQV